MIEVASLVYTNETRHALRGAPVIYVPRTALALIVLAALSLAPSAAAQEQTLTSSSERKARQLFVKGLTKAQVGEHEAALSLYEKALKKASDQPAVLSAAAKAYQATGDAETALLYARRAAQQASDRPFYARRLAGLLAETGRPAEAADAYRSVLERFPDDRSALRALARLHRDESRPAEALGTYARLLEAGADSAAVLARMTPIYRNAPDGAAANLPPALRNALTDRKAPPDSTDSAKDGTNLVTRAHDLAETDPAEARHLLRRALDANSSQPEARELLGTLLLRNGEYDEAAEYLTQATRQNPRDPARWRRATEALRRSGRPAEARSVAEEGLLLFPGHLPLLAAAARSALDDDAPAAALNRANEALDMLDNQPEQHASFLVIKGDALAAQNQAEAARSNWQQARQLDPDNTDVQERLREQ